ncbi:MAG: DUF1614 domain-containing protein [Candidatus Binataceae bacterium]
MIFAPFVFIYAMIFFIGLAFLFVLIEIHVINYVFVALGLPPHLAFVALLLSLSGSYLNIPIAQVDGGPPHPAPMVQRFGVRYRVPTRYAGGATTIAINVGGAIVPMAICAYVLIHFPAILMPAILGAAIVTLVVHRFARPVAGMGIATPMLIPPVVAAIVGALLGTPTHHADAVAYVSGVMGTLVGADLLNLRRLRELGAPVASIGGAGTFDGIFLTGIVAVLLA